MSQARAEFDLSRGRSVEAGLKTLLWGDRLALTASAYRIAQDDILTRDPNDFALTVQGGEQSSTGVELAFSAEVTERLRVDGNLSYLNARFDELLGGDGTDLAGNTPSNVPERTLNGNASYTFGAIPVTVGLNVISVGDFFTDDANTIRVAGYDVWGASLTYDSAIGSFTLRGRNLADRLYVNWSGYSPTMVYLGEPRSFDVTWIQRF